MTLASHGVGIIGAGLSGLMAGRILQDRGVSVTLFDKARRPGGRANTREHGAYRFDHGAQFFTIRDPVIESFLESWVEVGAVAEWKGSLVRFQGGKVEPAKTSVRYVGVPDMITLASTLAHDLEVRVDTRALEVFPVSRGWALRTSNELKYGPFDTVLVALPAPQATDLLSNAPELRAKVEGVEMAPCWAGMYVFDQPLPLDFDGAFVADEALSWVARNSSKPGRPEEEAWVLHASPVWSRENLRIDREVAAAALLREFEALVGAVPGPVFRRGHRWALALPSKPVARGVPFDADLGIGACGDWCMGGRVEGALLSGVAAAHQILVQRV